MSVFSEVILHPPSYSAPSADLFTTNANSTSNPTNDAACTLPAYSPPVGSSTAWRHAATQIPPKEFNYELKSRGLTRGKIFAQMTIVSEGLPSMRLPTFLEGQQINGRLKLCLDKPQSFESIVVHLRGRVITGTNNSDFVELTFVDITHPLWSQSIGDPRDSTSNFLARSNSSTSSSPRSAGASPDLPAPRPPLSSASRASSSTSQVAAVATGLPLRFTGKVPEGEYTWEFSIAVPREVTLPFGPRNEPQVFHSPQTFNERHTRANVAYEVMLKLSRNKNKLFQGDHTLMAPIGYLPVVCPPDFTFLRKLAYQEGSPLLGPNIDPEGWHGLEAKTVRGHLFNNRLVNITCFFYLAKPLSYTRGTVIPLYMELESDDTQALDLLSSPKAIVIRLQRRIKYDLNTPTSDSLAWKDSIDRSQPAVWWPSSEDTPPGRRVLNGELHLQVNAKPTSFLPHFKLEYSLVFLAFNTAGFEGFEKEQLLETPVDVITAYAPGPRPKSTAPPGCKTEPPNMFPLRYSNAQQFRAELQKQQGS